MKKDKDDKRPFMSGLFGFAAFDAFYTARENYLADLARYEDEGGKYR